MTRYVVFNGPPEAGKSTAAHMLIEFLRNKQLRVIPDSFATPMKHFVATMMAQQYHVMKKDAPVAELGGISVRRFLIHLSEEYMKPVYGTDIFGRMLYYRSLRAAPPPDFVVIDDSGFYPEFDALGEPNNRYLVRVTRPGKTYDGDSRGYLNGFNFHITNDSDVEALRGNTYALSNTLVLIHRGEL